jgi:hypothetical protein
MLTEWLTPPQLARAIHQIREEKAKSPRPFLMDVIRNKVFSVIFPAIFGQGSLFLMTSNIAAMKVRRIRHLGNPSQGSWADRPRAIF